MALGFATAAADRAAFRRARRPQPVARPPGGARGITAGAAERLLRSSPLGPDPMEGEIAYFAVAQRHRAAVESEAAGSSAPGLPEATILPPHRAVLDPTNEWLAALPSLARAELRSLLVIDLGAGLVLEGVPESVALST